jgi:hypothetical protein
MIEEYETTMIESRYVEGIYNPIGSYYGRDPAGEPTEDVEYGWVFSHSELFDWDECDGEFHSRRLFFKEYSVVIYECSKCQEKRMLEELQIAAAETYLHNWESKCKREVVK